MATTSIFLLCVGWTRSVQCPLRHLGNNRPLPSLARPSLLHRLDCKDSKIFVHPLGTRLDVGNGHTRSLSHCHLVWWTKESRGKSKTLHKPDAAPRREHPIDVTRSPVADESRTCRQHLIRAQGRVFNRACGRCTQEDRRCDRVPCQQKHRFLPDPHTRIHDGGECQHNENTQTLPSRPIAPTVIPQFPRRLSVTSAEPAELVFRSSWPRSCCPRMSFTKNIR